MDQTNLPLKQKTVDVSDKHTKLKIAVAVTAVIVALVAFGVGIGFSLSENVGWKLLSFDTQQENCSGDFVCYYYLEKGGWDGKTQLDNVKNAYAEACINAYRIFNAEEEFDGMCNLATLNNNPNRELTPDPALYSALELVQQANSRTIFFAPIYTCYYNVFFAFNEAYAMENDPHRNEGAAQFVQQVMEYASDDVHISLQLANGKAKLSVSEQYAELVGSWDCPYLDFFVLKNAFIADYIAQFLEQKGYGGIISSFDGYMRSFLNDNGCSLNIFDLDGNLVRHAAVLSANDELSAVRFRDYDSAGTQYDYFYTYPDGSTVTPYLADGFNSSCMHDLLTYSHTQGCAYVALHSLPVYTAEQLDDDGLMTLKGDGIFSVYCKDKTVCYNDPDAQQGLEFSSDDGGYTGSFVG